MKVVLSVYHDGKPKMVGKLFEYGAGHVFLHQESGSQYHRNLDSPGGLDVVLVQYLEQLEPRQGPIVIHHWDPGRNELLEATPATVTRDGIRQTYDRRDRYYLPYAFWRPVAGGYKIPWVNPSHILDPRQVRIDWVPLHVPGEEREEPQPSPQLGLFGPGLAQD